MVKNRQPGQRDEKKIAAVALQAFFSLSQKWNLSDSEQCTLLGSPSQASFDSWKTQLTADYLSPDTLDRISYLIGIYKTLNILLPSSEAVNEWIHKNNTAPLFEGGTALNKMLSGDIEDLSAIRRYLYAQCDI